MAPFGLSIRHRRGFTPVAVFSGHPSLPARWGLEGQHPDFLDEKYLKPFKGKSLFIAHGRKDQNLPFDAAERMVRALEAAGATVQFVPDDTGHETSTQTRKLSCTGSGGGTHGGAIARVPLLHPHVRGRTSKGRVAQINRAASAAFFAERVGCVGPAQSLLSTPLRALTLRSGATCSVQRTDSGGPSHPTRSAKNAALAALLIWATRPLDTAPGLNETPAIPPSGRRRSYGRRRYC